MGSEMCIRDRGDVDGGSTPDAAQSDAAPSDRAVVSDAAVRDGGPRPPADVLVPPSQDAGPPLATVCERACQRATATCGGSLMACVRDCTRAESSLPPACLSVFTDAIACVADRGFVCGSGGATPAPGCEMLQQAVEDCATTTDPPPMVDGGVMPPPPPVRDGGVTPPPTRDGGIVDAGVAPYCADACAQIASACGGSAPTNCTSGCSASATMYSASCPAEWDRYVRCLASPGGVLPRQRAAVADVPVARRGPHALQRRQRRRRRKHGRRGRCPDAHARRCGTASRRVTRGFRTGAVEPRREAR